MSHPWTEPILVVQRRLLASPHSGLRLAFTCVICFQSPTGPAQTSGALEKVSRTTAVVVPSLATDTYGTNSPCARVSGPFHTGVIAPVSVRRATNVSPASIPVMRIPCELGSHVSEVAVDLESGVRFFIGFFVGPAVAWVAQT